MRNWPEIHMAELRQLPLLLLVLQRLPTKRSGRNIATHMNDGGDDSTQMKICGGHKRRQHLTRRIGRPLAGQPGRRGIKRRRSGAMTNSENENENSANESGSGSNGSGSNGSGSGNGNTIGGRKCQSILGRDALMGVLAVGMPSKVH
jgi:hypothetical protein